MNQATNLSQLKQTLFDTANEKKAIDIREYDVKDHTWLTDYVVVIGVSNIIHCKAVVTSLINTIKLIPEENLNEIEVNTVKQSGTEESGWVILDLGVMVIHCINNESRLFYKLDDLLEKQGTVYHY
jgi:ribosome-associated protein